MNGFAGVPFFMRGRPRFSAPCRSLVAGFLFVALFAGRAEGAAEAINLVHIKGSNAMTGVVQAWARAYQASNPGVYFEVNGGGSGNGIAALINGHVDVAVTTRPLKPREVRLISQRSGSLPNTYIIGQDALSVIVNKANPLNGVTLVQLARIFGKTDGYSTWTDLGIEIPNCPENQILRLSRKNNSGDYAYFREFVLNGRAHFHPSLVTIRQSDKLTEKVSMSPCAIGFTSMATVTNEVKTLCIAQDEAKGTACIPPTTSYTHKGLYPLSRPLYFYTLGDRASLVAPFVDWVQGTQGQEILRKAGFIALLESRTTPSPRP